MGGGKGYREEETEPGQGEELGQGRRRRSGRSQKRPELGSPRVRGRGGGAVQGHDAQAGALWSRWAIAAPGPPLSPPAARAAGKPGGAGPATVRPSV